MEDFLKFGFYPALAIFATVSLYVIARCLEKITKKKQAMKETLEEVAFKEGKSKS